MEFYMFLLCCTIPVCWDLLSQLVCCSCCCTVIVNLHLFRLSSATIICRGAVGAGATPTFFATILL